MIPLAKNITRYFSLKEIMVVVLAIVISVSAGVGVFLSLKREVAVNDNGKLYKVKTMKTTVKEILDQNGITVKPEDYISLPLDAKLLKMKLTEINIKRAVPVVIVADGQETSIMTYRDTVREAVANSPVKVGDMDKFDGPQPGDRIEKNMRIKIVRVQEDIVSENLPVAFNVVTKENNRMDQGTEKVVVEGSEGVREKQYKVVLEDGKEVGRQLVSDAVVTNPVDKVIEIGTVLNHKTARGDVIRYKKVLDMRSTAYTASYSDTGKDSSHPLFGITATGIKAYKGVIAVDPRVIPLGTRLYVEVAGSTPDYGYAVAADTGGAIKNDLIDLYFDDWGTANSWGIKRVKVYILND